MSHTVEGAPAPTIDFAALGTQAAAMLDAPSAQPTTPPAATPAASPVPSATPAPVSTPSPQPPSVDGTVPPAQPATPPTYTVDLGNGRTETLTVDQIRELHANGLRQADYTRKTQELAQQRQEAAQLQAQLQQVMSNPAALLQLAQQVYGAQQPAVQQPPLDPNAPMTLGQFQQWQQVQQQQYAALQQGAAKYVEDRLQTAQYAESINGTLGELFKQHPVLTLDPTTEDVIRYKVAQMQPQSLADAQAAFKTVAAEMVNKFDTHYKQQTQQAEAQRAQLAATGTEPPGGSAPQAIQQPTFVKNHQIDWKALSNAALTQMGQ